MSYRDVLVRRFLAATAHVELAARAMAEAPQGRRLALETRFRLRACEQGAARARLALAVHAAPDDPRVSREIAAASPGWRWQEMSEDELRAITALATDVDEQCAPPELSMG